MPEKQKQRLMMSVSPTSSDLLQCRLSCWRPFINSMFCYLNTTKSRLNLLCPNGLMNGTIIFSPLWAGKWHFGSTQTYSLLSPRLKKWQRLAKRTLFKWLLLMHKMISCIFFFKNQEALWFKQTRLKMISLSFHTLWFLCKKLGKIE